MRNFSIVLQRKTWKESPGVRELPKLEVRVSAPMMLIRLSLWFRNSSEIQSAFNATAANFRQHLFAREDAHDGQSLSFGICASIRLRTQ